MGNQIATAELEEWYNSQAQSQSGNTASSIDSLIIMTTRLNIQNEYDYQIHVSIGSFIYSVDCNSSYRIYSLCNRVEVSVL